MSNQSQNQQNLNPDVDEFSGVNTTGHEWDGIKELNNPLPRWWLIIFYFSIFTAFVYWIFMPSWPGISGYLHGTRHHSERKNVAEQMVHLEQMRAENAQKLLSAVSLSEIENDPELLQFAMAAGKSAFGDNCAMCHGMGGRGFKGYPNLNDDVWLWGGTLDDIKQTITYGIRANSDETRISAMPAFGTQNILSADQINDLVEYVKHLSGEEADRDSVERAASIFKTQCSACHGEDGKGDRNVGAPNLTDTEWLYGNSTEDIRETIYYARNSVMPNWNERLNEETITALAVYVHTLGGGE